MKKRLHLFLFAVTLLLTACVGTTEINQQAESAYQQQMAKYQNAGKIDRLSTTAKRVHQIFNQMRPFAQAENRTGVPFQWQINVIKSPELNAWAMPGGKMVFYTGIVEKLNLTNDEIATVMGHEMAHALKEHGKAQTNFDTATGVLAQIGHVALSQVVGEELSGYAVGITRDAFFTKPYSRSAETEADEVGLMLMAKSGFNPQAAPRLWQKMQQASGGGQGALSALLSTHPSDEARQENLQRLLPKAMAIYQAR